MYDNRRMTEVLVPSSGKMVLLDKLLPKLKKEGHKVSGWGGGSCRCVCAVAVAVAVWAVWGCVLCSCVCVAV
jgi:hypothetical protein